MHSLADTSFSHFLVDRSHHDLTVYYAFILHKQSRSEARFDQSQDEMDEGTVASLTTSDTAYHPSILDSY
jgi:hypothetical protein